MIKSERFRAAIPDPELEQWLLGQGHCRISDIQLLVQFWPSLWERSLCLILLSRTDPIERIREVHWIHRMPRANCAISREAAEVIAKSLMPDNFFSAGSAFVRLYSLSFSDGGLLSDEIISFVTNLMFDKDEFVAAGALQVVTIWLLSSGIQLPNGALYQSAAQLFDAKRPLALCHLYRILMKILGSRSESAAIVLSAEPDFAYESHFGRLIQETPWCFPGFGSYLDGVASLRLASYAESMKALGCIVDLLGMVEA
jgi:hypothetical protein